MKDLKRLNLKPEYRSDEGNLVDSFYVPCLSVATEYRRAVGYFTGQGLSLAAKGLAAFIGSQGRMRLIASPLLQARDAYEIERGYTARSDAVARAVLAQLDDMDKLDQSSVVRQRVASLAWLVAEGRLDVKLAIRRRPATDTEAGEFVGIYHEKVGLFSDSEDQSVAFTGSANESAAGLVGNFESIDVFWSWDDPHERVSRKDVNFERLWVNETDGLQVLEFPAAAKDKLIQFRPARQPELDPESTLVRTEKTGSIRANGTAREFKAPNGLALYEHQEQAINAWFTADVVPEGSHHSGFLAMATGSGKTITALCAAARLFEQLGRLAVVVVAPTKVLVDQWAAELRRFGLLPILAHSDNRRWRQEAWQVGRAYARRRIPVAALVATNLTFMSRDFQALLNELGHPAILIADEAHNLGASGISDQLPANIEYRLALSATPTRHFDDAGTRRLFDYFGTSVFEFSLRDAIGVCLTPYDYFVTPVELTDHEMERYRALTLQIARMLSSKADEDDGEAIDRLRIRRASILNSAARKLDAASSLIDELNSRHLRHMFIYTSDKDPRQTTDVIRLLQDTKGMLVHQFTEAETSDPDLRRTLLQRFADGSDLQVLVSKRCLDEGVDIPPTRIGLFMASSTNPRQFIQRRGRLLRMYPDKPSATIHDLFVIPPSDWESSADETERGIIRTELRRVAEFADGARNGAAARLSLTRIAEAYGALGALAGAE